MDKSSTYETVPEQHAGKTYGYQAPQEAATEGPRLDEHRKKLMAAFADFMDALMARTGVGAASGAAPSAGTSAAPAGGAPGVPAASAGSPTGALPAAGGGMPTAGRAAPAAGTGAATAPHAGPGASPPYTGPNTRAPSSGGSATPAQQEAQEMSVYAQREAYRLDRARETRRREANQKAVAPPFMAAATGVPTPATGNKHQRVSNRTPVTASKEFAPAYGSNGKPTAPTMERVAVRMSRRPESAPAAGVPRAGRPIDAYWGSYGTAIERAAVRARVDHKGLEAIIGNDDRTRVADCTEYPWRCICSLLITANTGAQYIGTGWLVAPRVLLTAGHCVYMSDEGGWVTQIEVIPGRDADARPYGSAIAREVRSVGGWTVDGDSNYDYGVILLPSDKRYGDELGWLGYAHRDDDYLAGLTLNLSGYPADGGRAPNQVDGTQWYHSRNVKEVLPSQLTYEIDTFGGQSGSPVWEMTSSGDRYGVAVHTWGTSVSNGGTRITGEVFDNIVQWISEAP